MKIKVCGMRERDNIEAVMAYKPDYLGFIFYPPSPRYAGESDAAYVQSLPGVQTTGVFVDAGLGEIEAHVSRFGLRAVQLHGQESPALCDALRAGGLEVIKVFSVGEAFDFRLPGAYEGHADLFLFDTLGKQPGGNGQRFRWELLETYPLATPYLLSGGIGPEHAALLSRLRLPGMVGVDINSRFELRPGEKDPALAGAFIAHLRNASKPAQAQY
jgi:phosphoribosylanthranilate isomerase